MVDEMPLDPLANMPPKVRRMLKLHELIQDSRVISGWHWLGYNFTSGTDGSRYFAPLTLSALDTVDQQMPGYARRMIERLDGMGGRDRDMRDYEAIVAWLAELVVVHHLVTHQWRHPVTFVDEPSAGKSKKNPEILISLETVGKLGVEVKSPDLTSHRKVRSTNPWQMVARTGMTPADLAGGVTLPTDNKIKDFLSSADAKFSEFRAADEDFRSVLVIVWDDFINEPITALLSPSSGLLTPNSFHLDPDGNPYQYPNVDAVLVMRHQHQLREGMANRLPIDERANFLDYGTPEAFPPHILIPNPFGKDLNREWIESLHGWSPSSLNHMAEYVPGEIVMWIDTESGNVPEGRES